MSMKGSPGALVASVLAASTAALAGASGDQNVACLPWPDNSNEGRDPSSSGSEVRADARSSAEDKFTPRFDGLRFIETLVTAHR
ncbi:uncharacterized protein J3R85_004436 [Psidium guajava]|nr:uncharacterized protein J3R85_004436 [Psidium guajava]